jgi:hypothetical protein
MLASAAAIYGVGASSAFDYAKLQVDGLQFTDSSAVEAKLADVRGRNMFGLSTAPLAAALETLSTVEKAHVDVRLPGTLGVTLEERRPILIWQVGERRYLADSDGALFALLGKETPPGAAGLPVIEDQRAASAGLSVNQTLDPVDLDAATRLASLVPADVGSGAVSLGVITNDSDGFVLETRPKGWSAVFGFYTPSLRTTDLIPGQVRLLRSLLAGREQLVDRVNLATATDGTYTPRATPKASSKPKPSTAP